MKTPSGLVLTIGHPVVAAILAIGGGLVLIQSWAQGDKEALAVGGFVAACIVNGAYQQRSRYMAWKRQWDAAAGIQRSLRSAIHTAVTLAIVVIIFVAAYKFGSPNESDDAFLERVAIGYAICFGPLVLFAILRAIWRRRVRRPRKTVPVAIVANNLISVPSLRGAYRALPEHCHRVLER